jgi:hypothetical protein
MLVPLPSPVPDAVADTDWSAYTVVDVVDFLPATTAKYEDDHLRTEVYRYRDQAPPPSTYENGERRYRVRRATRPLVERLETREGT